MLLVIRHSARFPLFRPVHPDDKKLVGWLIRNGDGIEDNEALEAAIATAAETYNGVVGAADAHAWCAAASTTPLPTSAAASTLNSVSAGVSAQAAPAPLRFAFHRRPTVFKFPPASPALRQWAAALEEIDLRGGLCGALTVLPEAFYRMANLRKIDLSDNCLLELSPSLKHLAKLQSLRVHNNCLETLPNELELMQDLTELTCHDNRIFYPPAAVLEGGESGPGPAPNAVLHLVPPSAGRGGTRCLMVDSGPSQM